MVFIDTHTHLFAEEFNDDIELVIERAKQLNVQKMLLPNIDIESIGAMKACAERFPNHCFPMIGIHPCSVNENTNSSMGMLDPDTGQELILLSFDTLSRSGLDVYRKHRSNG